MIAADAGVDASMVIHWFGSKERLFAAALRIPADHRRTVETILDGPRSRLALARHGLRFAHLAAADPELLVAAVGPTLQRYLTGRLTAAAPRKL